MKNKKEQMKVGENRITQKVKYLKYRNSKKRKQRKSRKGNFLDQEKFSELKDRSYLLEMTH